MIKEDNKIDNDQEELMTFDLGSKKKGKKPALRDKRKKKEEDEPKVD